MKNKKIVLSSVIIFLCLIVGFIFIQYYLNHNVDYQLKKLQNGSLEQKLWAADFLGQKKIIAAIPLLMSKINDVDGATYKNKSPETLSCVATFSLEKIIDKKIGDTCCYYECEEKNGIIINKWQDWYKNEYPQWLKEHQQN